MDGDLAESRRSRTPSRSRTPNPKARLVVPSLRASTSLTNLRVHGQGANAHDVPPVPSLPLDQAALDSSASSVVNLDTNEGILIQDLDAEVEATDGEEGIAIGHLDSGLSRDEQSKQSLREKLRKTLSSRSLGQSEGMADAPRSQKQTELNELNINAAAKYAPREYFVLTDAGKPVFTSRPGSEDGDGMTSVMGVMQALISVFIDDNDKLRSVNAGNTRITFLLRSPLYYVCASSWGEPEFVTRNHLEYLHLQILSIVSAAQLRRIFERRTNFDLRRLLNGAESFLFSMLNRLEFDLAMTTSSLNCLKLESALRKRISDTIVPNSKMKDILYVAVLGRGKVVTLIRPRKHSIHPADIHILLNTIHNPSILNSPAASSFIPVCLPKFNPSGFVNAYISFLRKDVDLGESEERSSAIDSDPHLVSSAGTRGLGHDQDSGIALVCLSGGGEFENIRSWCTSAAQKLEDDGSLSSLATAITTGNAEYGVSELGVPGLRHFIYKSRPQVQITFPVFEDPYDSVNERRRIITLYQILHDAIHAKSGQEETLKLQYIRTEKESVMGWITQPFELYITLSPRLPKSAAVGAANSVARWVKKEESRLFLKDAPVF